MKDFFFKPVYETSIMLLQPSSCSFLGEKPSKNLCEYGCKGQPLVYYSIRIDVLDWFHVESWLQHCNLVYPYLCICHHDKIKEAQQFSLIQCTLNKIQWIIQQCTFQQWMFLVGIDSWYNLSTPLFTAQLDTSTVNKLNHTTWSPSLYEQLGEPLCQKMKEENTSLIDKG